MRSEKAVSFFTFVKASEVKDVKKYNHAVSVLWSAGTVLFEILGNFSGAGNNVLGNRNQRCVYAD